MKKRKGEIGREGVSIPTCHIPKVGKSWNLIFILLKELMER